MITRKYIAYPSLCKFQQCRSLTRTAVILSNNWTGKGNKPKSEKGQTQQDPWHRVNDSLKKRSATLGSITGIDASERIHGKSVYSKERTPGGSATEHVFPVHPVYPRIADEMTPEQKESVRKEKWSRNTTGTKMIVVYGLFGAFLLFAGWQVWYRLWKYYIPAPVYSSGKYAKQLEIEHVVFLDLSLNGEKIGRVHIGLFHNDAPNWTENFHRCATGNTESGASLVGTKFWKCNDRCLYGGDLKGTDGKCGVVAKGKPGEYIPEDKHNNHNIPFGLYAAGAFTHRIPDMNDTNFMILMDEGRAATFGCFTCVGMVLRGFNIIEMIANLPRQPHPFLLDSVEVTASGISPLSGDKERIAEILHRFHDGRLKRYLSKHPIHRADHEYYGEIAKKHIQMRKKKEQVEEELKGAKVNEEAASA
eukprot:TRINITY_DN974_c0_g1_i3.p1 TRINITY_DN974_c0_g1~~TRINITY_DN974_c0_g1_i3.p1  ORF type:complete len:419 (+),score=51.39 TRINITY_DN974_c0_g1_i3:126-1382(+)